MKASKISLFLSFLIVPVQITCAQFPVDFSCWQDNPRQCHGDADGMKIGPFWVYAQDLQILQTVYYAPGGWPKYYPESTYYDPRADFDRDFIVSDYDIDILDTYFGHPNVPADCGKKLELESLEGDCIVADTNYVIEWDWRIFTEYIPMPPYRDVPGPIRIYYSIDSNSWILIDTVTGVRGANSYEWLVASEVFEQCWLKISDINHTGLTDTKYWTYDCSASYDSDWDGDCYVGFNDFAILAYSWIEPSGTDMNDLSDIADEWCFCSNVCDEDCAP